MFENQSQRNHWGNHVNTSKFNGLSPTASYNYASHSNVHSSPSSHGTAVHSAILNQQLLAPPCQSSPHVNMASPPSQARPGSQVNITAQNNVSPVWNRGNSSNVYTSPISNTSTPQNGGFYNSLIQDRSFDTNIAEDKDPLSMSPRNVTDQQRLMMQSQDKGFLGMFDIQKILLCATFNCNIKCIFNIADGNVMTGQSPAQASVAPSPLRLEPQVPQPSMGAPYAPMQPQNATDKDPAKGANSVNNRFPVVKIGRLPVRGQ